MIKTITDKYYEEREVYEQYLSDINQLNKTYEVILSDLTLILKPLSIIDDDSYRKFLKEQEDGLKELREVNKLCEEDLDLQLNKRLKSLKLLRKKLSRLINSMERV